jgi:Tfp pilus assembly protein PilW
VSARLAMPLLAAGLAAAGAVPCHAQEAADEPQVAGTLVRWFTDSDHVSVRSLSTDWGWPLARGSGLTFHYNNERVLIPAISAPPGSQEAIDAITTASRPISGNAFEDFVKTRNEVQGEYEHGPAAVSYYVSSESDYLAQQVAGRWNRDFRAQTVNLSLGSSVGWDAIAPVQDDDTHTGDAHKTTLHWNAVMTEVVSPTLLVRYGVEYNLVNGLQHNPYRNVYAGGTNVPERHPDERQRRDAFLRVNQALPNRASLKFSYRFYNDDWGVNSHELGTRLSQYVTRGLSARWEYRYYTQTAADFFRTTYASVNGVDGFLTGDYRLGVLSSHLFGASLRADLEAFAPTRAFTRRMTLWLDLERYFNSNNYSANVVETGVDFRFP